MVTVDIHVSDLLVIVMGARRENWKKQMYEFKLETNRNKFIK